MALIVEISNQNPENLASQILYALWPHSSAKAQVQFTSIINEYTDAWK